MTTIADLKPEVRDKGRRKARVHEELEGMEQRLMALLQQDGRLPNTTLAARLNISEGSVRRHLKRLLDRRAMSVVAVPNWKALGYGTEALVGLRVDLPHLEAVASKLAALKPVHSVMTVTGPFDIFCSVVARSTVDLGRFLETEVAAIAGVRTAQTFLALTVNKREHLVQEA